MAQTTTASFEYLHWQDLYKKQKPYEVFLPRASFGDKHAVPRSNLSFETREIPIQDVRGREESFKLDIHGFEFARQTTTAVENLKDKEYVLGQYVPEMEAFLKEYLCGGEEMRTLCFDHRLRQNADRDAFMKKTVNLEDGFDPLLPATHPHIDQTEIGAIRRVRRHLPDEAEELLKGRVRVINLWRPLKKVESWPLALCDSQSVKADTLVSADIVRRRYDVDEVTLLQIYDSEKPPTKNGGIRCLHSSFNLDGPDVIGRRESLEIRMLVFSP
ncbi:hypothetical protein VTK73DRAFT_3674 [Phialemonium thermophilum]|uniref:Methyltransferase n=1 Tax=Phialemonium thermophilum TaxID=223376 RepID=A0ABR3WXM4_9PEZI